MSLRVFNTLGRKLEPFEPLKPPRVGMYVCGPTVYGHSHLGHAKSYVAFDAIVRWLRFSGYDVSYVQNITDVGHLTDDADEGEDKVVAEARRRSLHPMAVVEIFMRSYLDDMDAMNLVRPDIMPRATGHIPEQLAQIEELLKRGHAYEVNGSVYFDVASFAGYGKLSGRKTDELEAGARIAVSDDKRSPADFALWKRADASHIMRWPSPWGDGFPGWHIECSAMSQKYLGDTFDIHGGGLENQFPHHECEIAQAEGATGKPFARYWLHNNMCTINGQKMGKSLGNSVFLKDIFYTNGPLHSKPRNADEQPQLLLERAFEPVVVKHFILTSHYRQTLDFSNEALKAAESGCYRLRDSLAALRKAADEASVPPNRTSHSTVASGLRAGRDSATTATSHEYSNRTADATPSPLTAPITAPTETIRTALTDIRTRFATAMNDD
ncbi:MAG: cysteine--tRNA ligase, partial [Phycisphaerae bacterium]